MRLKTLCDRRVGDGSVDAWEGAETARVDGRGNEGLEREGCGDVASSINEWT